MKDSSSTFEVKSIEVIYRIQKDAVIPRRWQGNSNRCRRRCISSDDGSNAKFTAVGILQHISDVETLLTVRGVTRRVQYVGS